MTNNCCATEQQSRYFSLTEWVFSVNSSITTDMTTYQWTRNKPGIAVATNHSSMGKPNIATGCYFSQFAKISILLPRNFVVNLCLSTVFLAYYILQIPLGSISLPFMFNMATTAAIHLLHASPLQSACRILEKCHEFHTSPHSNQRDPRDSFKVLNSYRPCPISQDIDIAFCRGQVVQRTGDNCTETTTALLLLNGRWIRGQLKTSNFFSPPKSPTTPLWHWPISHFTLSVVLRGGKQEI